MSSSFEDLFEPGQTYYLHLPGEVIEDVDGVPHVMTPNQTIPFTATSSKTLAAWAGEHDEETTNE